MVVDGGYEELCVCCVDSADGDVDVGVALDEVELLLEGVLVVGEHVVGGDFRVLFPAAKASSHVGVL